MNHKPKRENLVGMKFNRLTVLEFAGTTLGRAAIWRCQCDCGNITNVRASKLKNNIIKSCGCYKKEQWIRDHTTHGHSSKQKKSSTYSSWLNMKARCSNSSCHEYHNYGGRGISICERWNSFENFLSDMGECPDGLSLDRIDNNGNYEPSNCRWANAVVQGNNRRNNRRITYNGETKTLSEWSRILDMNWFTLFHRLKAGISVEDAFTNPVQSKCRIQYNKQQEI